MDNDNSPAPPRLLTPGEVAAIYLVRPSTVTRWGRLGKLPSIQTPSGRRLFREDDIRAALNPVQS